MALSASNLAIWEEIERSERCLVSCMYDEAAAIASAVLRDICLCSDKFTKPGEDTQLNDMLESAGMVLVQSLKEAGRTQEILNQLKILFGSVTAIPFQVFLAGVCFQISEGPCSDTQEYVEEFLSKWRYVDEQYYVLGSTEPNLGCVRESGDCLVLGVDEYFEVVEVYVGKILRDKDCAISWVDRAALPEEKRQELLRRLHSLYSPNALGPSQGSAQALPAHESEADSAVKERSMYGGTPKALKVPYQSKGQNKMKETIMKLSQQRVSRLWWFRTINLKFGNGQLVISNGKIVLGSLLILMYYILQRKRATLKTILKRQVLSTRKALMDLWQLAFSYQVNPLAAVQPLPPATRGSR
ncbi:hypothetical protein NMG60_11023856 [Bertholletia excelsa]